MPGGWVRPQKLNAFWSSIERQIASVEMSGALHSGRYGNAFESRRQLPSGAAQAMILMDQAVETFGIPEDAR